MQVIKKWQPYSADLDLQIKLKLSKFVLESKKKRYETLTGLYHLVNSYRQTLLQFSCKTFQMRFDS